MRSVLTLKQDSSRVLTNAVEALSLANSLESVTQIVARAARSLTGADGTSFVLRDGDKCYYADEDAISPLWKGLRFQAENCVSGWSMHHRESVIIEDIFKDPRVPQDAYRKTFVKSLCMVPIRDEAPVGAIGAYWASHHRATEDEIKFLQVLANSCAVAIENIELRNTMKRQFEANSGLMNRHKELETAMHSLAHDLRSPITTVTGFMELLKLRTDRIFKENPTIDPVVAQRIDDYISSVLKTCGNMSDQIARMLALYQVTNQTLNKQRIDMTALSHELAEDLKIQNPQRTIEFKIDQDLEAHADPQLIRLALENLLSNAVKYSSRKPQTIIQVGLEHGQGGAFFVRDNGEGFDPADAAKLFRPLVRLHNAIDFNGTGLGLVSVARIVELHGGSVRAEGEPKRGATFFFTLPA